MALVECWFGRRRRRNGGYRHNFLERFIMFGKIINWLKGNKTYVLGAGTVLYGVYLALFAGYAWEEVTSQIFDGTLIMTVRAAIAKIGVTGV